MCLVARSLWLVSLATCSRTSSADADVDDQFAICLANLDFCHVMSLTPFPSHPSRTVQIIETRSMAVF